MLTSSAQSVADIFRVKDDWYRVSTSLLLSSPDEDDSDVLPLIYQISLSTSFMDEYANGGKKGELKK